MNESAQKFMDEFIRNRQDCGKILSDETLKLFGKCMYEMGYMRACVLFGDPAKVDAHLRAAGQVE